MKKIYLTIFSAACLCMATSAQVTIDFTDASYDAAGLDNNLDPHVDWLCNNGATGARWKADGGNDRIFTDVNFSRLILENASTHLIQATAGQTVSITQQIKLGPDTAPFNTQTTPQNRLSYLIIGLKDTNLLTDGQQNREGVTVKTVLGTPNTLSLGATGDGVFDADPAISEADKNSYEILIEYTIGATAVNSVKKATIRNVSSGETSSIGTATGLNEDIYDAITGTGAYVFNWSLGFRQTGAVTRIIIEGLTYDNDATPILLSTKENNTFDFGVFPNPVKDVLNINTQETLEKVEIISLLGQTVLTFKDVNKQLNVSPLNKGLYIVKLTSVNGGAATKKLIIE